MADADAPVSHADDTPTVSPQTSGDSTETIQQRHVPLLKADSAPGDVEGMTELSPMRTHEPHGHEESVADRFAELVDDSDTDGEAEATVNHEKLERKELRRQKTSDKPNRFRDRLKRTISKAAE